MKFSPRFIAARTLRPGQGLLGIAELCDYLGVSRQTLNRIRREARPPFPQPITLLDGLRLQWSTSQIEEWILERQKLLAESV